MVRQCRLVHDGLVVHAIDGWVVQISDDQLAQASVGGVVQAIEGWVLQASDGQLAQASDDLIVQDNDDWVVQTIIDDITVYLSQAGYLIN